MSFSRIIYSTECDNILHKKLLCFFLFFPSDEWVWMITTVMHLGRPFSLFSSSTKVYGSDRLEEEEGESRRSVTDS